MLMVFMLTNLVDSADIGMIQCRRGTGLTQEALVGLLVLGDVIGQERNLRATKRCSLVSSALYTTPMPPLPSFSRMR